MPTLKIKITDITTAGGTSTGSYEWTSGPGTVSANGDIVIRGQAATDLEWSISAEGYTFATIGYSAPPIDEYPRVHPLRRLLRAHGCQTLTEGP